MFGRSSAKGGISSLLRSRRVPKAKKRTLVVGLKSDNISREMLLRLLTSVVMPGDYVLAVHVQEPNCIFDPNTFHRHEDLCKSKQVDFQIKVCVGESYISELSNQVRINFAAMLAVGCSSPCDQIVGKLLKELPPTCLLLVMDKGGKVLLQKPGTSQEGAPIKVLHSSESSLSASSSSTESKNKYLIQKSLSMPCSSTSTSSQPTENATFPRTRKYLQHKNTAAKNLFQRLAYLEIICCTRRFTIDELRCATDNFSPNLLTGEGGHSRVYRSNLDNGQVAAVKVLKNTQYSEDDLFGEVEILSNLKHENIIQLVGYCYSKDMRAIVYNLLKDSLKQRLKQLNWNTRLQVAIGVARGLEYLHSQTPPIIHRDVKSSNILLSGDCRPQISDFGAAVIHQQNQQDSAYVKPVHVVGTFGYLAPEYIMYGKVDEKIDVYSYGVVLLELITGKEAIQIDLESHHESLVLWARSLLSFGLCDLLVDPDLSENYNKDEMKTMMLAARLCLLHSSSRRPTMKTILNLLVCRFCVCLRSQSTG
ncbi:PTI1-like tyrosine-protein kinase 2 isoform X2 [Nicotiana tabacum]|uniref:PTI1-like tyrosine-protein kinase 2 isoform X2 n=1 Tax=Nicotiana tabacum TaxID=4097 RepID=A0A1S4BVU0_TOBAC|nr:PREDICTED: PTI1-like tyrosine-protein kinase 2 isoform X2 [Nicotiana tabacum]